MSNATPGPWRIRPIGTRFLSIDNEQGQEVVTVCRTNYCGKEKKDGWEREVYVEVPNADANAALIAAAPDLQVALDELVMCLDAEAQGVAMQTTKPERIAAARAALSKASAP